MTDKQIKAEALRRLEGNWGNGISLSVFMAAYVCFWVAVELLIYYIMKGFDFEYTFTADCMLGTNFGRFMTLLRICALFGFLLPEFFIMRRFFADISAGSAFSSTRHYIQHNTRRVFPRWIASSVTIFMLKFFVSVPLWIGIYGIYYCSSFSGSGSLTLPQMIGFMFSLGFSVVWAGVLVYYCLSLCLAKYIMTINPRAGVFDACDLSVKLMDGHRMRWARFTLSLVKYIPLILLFYPLFGIAPYFSSCYSVLAEEIMGDYWQDKFPNMVKRWQKHVG